MQSGAQNGIVSDEYGTELPETRIEENDLAAEKSMAKFSKSAEFKKLKLHLESRISHYQQYLPDGRLVDMTADPQIVGNMWMISNAIVGEFKAVLAAYDQANEVVKEEAAKKNVQ